MLRKHYPYNSEWLKGNKMLPLLWDGSPRNWLSLLMVLGWSIFSLIEIGPISFFTIIMIASFGHHSITDASKSGTITIYRSLPISRNRLTKLLWLKGVFVFPVCYIVISLIVRLIAKSCSEYSIGSIISVVFLTAALIVTLSSVFVQAVLLGQGKFLESFRWTDIIWFSLFIGMCGATHKLHPIIMGNTPWKILLLVVCGAILLVSYFNHSRLLRDPKIRSKKKTHKNVLPTYPRSRTLGWCIFWGRQLLQVFVGFIPFILIVGMAIQRNNALGNTVASRSILSALFLVIVPVFVSSMSLYDIRSLRILPMTVRRLSIFLTAIPVVNTLWGALLVVCFYLIAGLSGQDYYALFEATCLALSTAILIFGFMILIGENGLLVACLFLPVLLMFWYIGASFVLAFFSIFMLPALIINLQDDNTIYNRRSSPQKGGHSGRLEA